MKTSISKRFVDLTDEDIIPMLNARLESVRRNIVPGTGTRGEKEQMSAGSKLPEGLVDGALSMDDVPKIQTAPVQESAPSHQDQAIQVTSEQEIVYDHHENEIQMVLQQDVALDHNSQTLHYTHELTQQARRASERLHSNE